MEKEEILKKILKDEPQGIREKFLKHPKEALKDLGVELSEDVEIKIFRVPQKTIPFILPENIEEWGDLSDEELDQVFGGVYPNDTARICGAPPRTPSGWVIINNENQGKISP